MNKMSWGRVWRAGRAAAMCIAATAAVAAPGAEQPTEAPVVVANRPVAVLRASFLGVSPERRARRSEAILQELIDKSTVGEVKVQTVPQGHALMIDGELGLLLVADDADPLRGQTLAQASAAARASLQQVIAETREARDSQRLLGGAGRAALATLLAAVGPGADLARRATGPWPGWPRCSRGAPAPCTSPARHWCRPSAWCPWSASACARWPWSWRRSSATSG